MKIRLGERKDSISKLCRFCKFLEEQGVDCIIIHARFDDDKFCRKPHWSRIKDVKRELSIPVVANGGISSIENARRCITESGADGLMIGRAAAKKPWIFRDIAKSLYGIEFSYEKTDIASFYFRFAELVQSRFRAERRLGRLKEFTGYFSESYKYGHYLASSVQNSKTLEEAMREASLFFDRSEKITA